VLEVLENPLHPYTQLLIASIPEGGNLGERLDIRRGSPSAAVDPPPGCRFVDRCALAIDRCRAVTPELVEARPLQSARCHVNAPSRDDREDTDANHSA
jgi:peptide/nickel transport system ATP-binding protein